MENPQFRFLYLAVIYTDNPYIFPLLHIVQWETIEYYKSCEYAH